MAKWIYWISLGVVFYTYIGYGLILLFLLTIRRTFASVDRKISNPELPEVALIVAAFNEESCIAAKVENSLSLDYPSDKLKFIFVSDGSTDQTAAILDRYESIVHLHQHERQGKSAALNRAVKGVDSPILVFSDANALLNPASIRYLVSHFGDNCVGAVSGEKKVIPTSGSAAGAGEGMYWKYESVLKRWDAEFYTIVGAAGELFSIRRVLYEEMKHDTVLDDFYQSLRVCLKGYRVGYEPRAFATEHPSASLTEEHKRKVRICAGGFQAMGRLGKLFNPFLNPRLSFQYISHRVLRWTMAPLCLVLLLIANIIMVKRGAGRVYELLLWAQLAFYALAILGWFFALLKRPFRLLNLPYYFLIMQVAVVQGFIRFLRKGQAVTWEKSEREKASVY